MTVGIMKRWISLITTKKILGAAVTWAAQVGLSKIDDLIGQAKPTTFLA